MTNSVLVLRIIDGRFFPRSDNIQLVWKATFQGQSSNSDAIVCSVRPVFNTEFSWSLESSAMSKLLSQNTVIRLQCMTIDKSGFDSGDVLGHMVLDLRSADNYSKAPARLRQLAGIKPGSGKPELRFCLFYADQEHYMASSSGRASSPARNLDELDVGESMLSSEPPRMQLGSGSDSVSLSMKIEVNDKGTESILDNNAVFYLRFEIFGIEVGSEDYVGAEVLKLGELFEMDLFTSSKDLEEYANEHGIISVFLYQDNIAIGHAIMDISKLTLPYIVENYLSFVPLNENSSVIENLKVSLATRFSDSNDQKLLTTRVSEAHQFRVSIDTHSVQMLSPQNSVLVYTGYKYPALGSPSPIYALPPIETSAAPIVDEDSPTGLVGFYRLKNSFNGFEIVFTPKRLQETLNTNALEIELWNRTSFQKDELIGVANVDMGDIQEKGKQITREDGTIIWVHDKIYPVFGPGDQNRLDISSWNRLIAHIRLVFSVEDFGPLEDGDAYMFEENHQMQSKKKVVRDEVIFSETSQIQDEFEDISESLNGTVDEDVAEWLFDEQQKFKKFLEENEKNRLNVISGIFDEQDKIFVAEHASEQQEIDELIMKLRTFMIGLLKREKSLQDADLMISNKKQNLKNTIKTKKLENDGEIQRLKQQYYSELLARNSENDRMRSLLEDQLSIKRELISKLDNLKKQKAVTVDRQNISSDPIRKLKTELEDLKIEITDLQKQSQHAELKTYVMKRRYADILSENDERGQLIREEQENKIKQERVETETQRFQEWLLKSRLDLQKDLEDMRMLKQTAVEALNRCTLREIQQEKSKMIATISAKDRQLVEDFNTITKTSSWTLEDDEDEKDGTIYEDSLDQSLESLRTFNKKPPIFPEKQRHILQDLANDSDADTEYDEIVAKTEAFGEDERALIEELNSKYAS